MHPRGWRLRLQDTLEAIAAIEEFIEGLTFETFSADRRTVYAVILSFIIIGEAARHIPAEIEARYPAVPWADMRDMRNVIVHEYFRWSLEIVWDTRTNNLPPLVPLLREILEREP